MSKDEATQVVQKYIEKRDKLFNDTNSEFYIELGIRKIININRYFIFELVAKNGEDLVGNNPIAVSKVTGKYFLSSVLWLEFHELSFFQKIYLSFRRLFYPR